MTMLKPIDTRYKGHLFRSRLEARWAVFFDALGLSWEYEVEGYDLDGVWYLPDFKLKTPQGSDMWVEVKRSDVTEDPKFALFAEAVTKQNESRIDLVGGWTRTMLVSGTPWDMVRKFDMCPRCGMFTPRYIYYDLGYESYHFECDVETPCGGDNPPVADGVTGVEYKPHKGNIECGVGTYSRFRDTFEKAALKAQQARFEHGAKG